MYELIVTKFELIVGALLTAFVR